VSEQYIDSIMHGATIKFKKERVSPKEQIPYKQVQLLAHHTRNRSTTGFLFWTIGRPVFEQKWITIYLTIITQFRAKTGSTNTDRSN